MGKKINIRNRQKRNLEEISGMKLPVGQRSRGPVHKYIKRARNMFKEAGGQG